MFDSQYDIMQGCFSEHLCMILFGKFTKYKLTLERQKQ